MNHLATEKISLKQIADELDFYRDCITQGNDGCEQPIKDILQELKSEKGLEQGVRFNYNHSTKDRLIFTFDYQHYHNGLYDGSTHHVMTITPKFGGYNLFISGSDKHSVKEYLYTKFLSIFE